MAHLPVMDELTYNIEGIMQNLRLVRHSLRRCSVGVQAYSVPAIIKIHVHQRTEYTSLWSKFRKISTRDISRHYTQVELYINFLDFSRYSST